jgi:tetratricopeptide (TPR) repeat protein
MKLIRLGFSGFLLVFCVGINLCIFTDVKGQIELSKDQTVSQDKINQNDLDKLRKTGFELIQQGKWIEAHLVFEQVLTSLPKDALSIYGDSLALFNLQRVPEAKKGIETAIEILYKSKKNQNLLADSLVLSAVIFASQKDNAAAIENLLEAVKISPDHFDANLSLGRAYYGDGNMINAIRFFRHAVKIQPQNLRARFFLATALERADNSEEALQEYRNILKIAPENADGNLGLGVLLIKLEGDKSAEGVKALQKAVAVNENLYEAQITLGKTLLRLKRLEEAVTHLLKAAEISPNVPEPHYQLALAYRKLGKKEEAENQLEIVKKIHEERRGVSDNK